MRVPVAFFMFCLFCIGSAAAQTLTKNSAGEQIIVYPDGSWRYFNQAPPGEAPASKPIAPEEEKYSKPKFDAEAEARARAVLRKQIQDELKQVGKLEKNADKLRKKEMKEAERVANLRSSSASKDLEQIGVANRKLQDARQLANNADAIVNTAKSRITKLEQALPMTRSARKAFFLQTGISTPDPFASAVEGEKEPILGNQENGPEPVLVNKNRPERKPKQEGYVSYSIKNDPRYSPPLDDCSYTYNGVDEFTQKRRMNLSPRLLFGHTNPELKPYLGDESLVTCTGNLTRSGGFLILELDFVIRSQYANKEFGVLPKGSQLTLKLLNNEKVTLRNQTLSQGKFDPVEKVFTYTARYTISNKQEKRLEKELLDQVRVMWGTGFDDYPIYEVDFFQRQLRCL